MKKKILAVILMLAAIAQSFAEGNSTAMQFVRVGRNPSSLALGGSSIALADNPYASLENMATAAFGSRKLAAGASYQVYAPAAQKSTAIGAAALYRINDRLTVSAAFVSQKGEPYDVFTITGVKAGTFTPGETLISAGGAYLVTESISVGTAVHYTSQSLAEKNNLSAITFDAHAAYKSGALAVSAGVNTIGGSVESQSHQKYQLPASAGISACYTILVGEKIDVSPSVQGDYFLSGGLGLSGGVQASYGQLVCLRAGYHLGTEGSPIPSFASVGIGAKFAGVSLDAAYLLASETLAGSLIFGLGYAF